MAKKTKGTTKKLDMRLTLMAFALIPMIISVIIIGSVLVNSSTAELKRSIHNSMWAIIEKVGEAYDYSSAYSCSVMEAYSQAPVIMEYLKNPDNTELAAKAEEYTIDFFQALSGWEGIYLADWDSKVLAHPAPPVVGRVMREGDRLTELRNAMLSADKIYNVGIITSPASGQLIESLYYPIYDENNNPVGYVGAGTFVSSVVTNFAEVDALGMESAYIYFVDSNGIMLFHPDESKIGSQVENAAVKGLVERLAAGETIKPGVTEYLYKGASKYAAYYVGGDGEYIAVLTADDAEVMSGINKTVNLTLTICLLCIVIFMVVAIVVARIVSKPLALIAKATEELGTGNVAVECNAHSKIKETAAIISAFGNLRDALNSSITNVKASADALNTAIVSVDEKTTDNVESVSQINNAIDEVASTSQTVAENAQIMAEKASELGSDIEKLNDNVSGLFTSSRTIKNVNDEATECMDSVYNGAKESVVAVQSISDKVAETNKAIEEIEKAVHAIEEIAAQTNLLSLNASIEAARAGDAGAGFAVVASEIRSLADSSAESAKEIKGIIANVVQLSETTVDISNKVSDIIRKEEKDIETAQGKFNVLSDSVQTSISEINTIKTMTERLDGFKVELINITTDLGAISEELGAAAEEVAASCQTVTSSCTDTQASTEEMRAINENMSSAIDFFKL